MSSRDCWFSSCKTGWNKKSSQGTCHFYVVQVMFFPDFHARSIPSSISRRTGSEMLEGRHPNHPCLFQVNCKNGCAMLCSTGLALICIDDHWLLSLLRWIFLSFCPWATLRWPFPADECLRASDENHPHGLTKRHKWRALKSYAWWPKPHIFTIFYCYDSTSTSKTTGNWLTTSSISSQDRVTKFNATLCWLKKQWTYLMTFYDMCSLCFSNIKCTCLNPFTTSRFLQKTALNTRCFWYCLPRLRTLL